MVLERFWASCLACLAASNILGAWMISVHSRVAVLNKKRYILIVSSPLIRKLQVHHSKVLPNRLLHLHEDSIDNLRTFCYITKFRLMNGVDPATCRIASGLPGGSKTQCGLMAMMRIRL
jgi:hypothetical protein